ncbi:MAG: cytochrome c oxidase subunit 3, partial [Oceanococcaceae bacterium]
PAAWPFFLTVGLFLMVHGVAGYLNGNEVGSWPIYAGLVIAIYYIVVWFRGIIHESESGQYSNQVDMTYRMGMAWFIFSEVMFFAAFFGALFYARQLSLQWLGGSDVLTNAFLWEGFEAVWPSNGPAEMGGDYQIIPPWGLPFINTLLLLASGVTLTFAHHGLRDGGNRTVVVLWMWATIALGSLFLFFQAEEYIEAYSHLNLTLESGIYGSTFFMLTGFHGMHVTLGTLMLIIITLRLMKGHFKPESHFGFEGVAWYWHFVDVVWLGLFIFVYIL